MNISNAKIVFILSAVFANFANAGYGDWNAQVIDVYGVPTTHFIKDVSEETHHGSMDFNEGGMEGLAVKKVFQL